MIKSTLYTESKADAGGEREGETNEALTILRATSIYSVGL